MIIFNPLKRLADNGPVPGPSSIWEAGQYLFALCCIFTAGCATALTPDSDPAEDTTWDTEMFSDSETETQLATDSKDTETFTDGVDTLSDDSELETDADSDSDTFSGTNSDTNSEFDTDECPEDDNKTEPGICGCGVADSDADSDGTEDCQDDCPNDPNKTEPGDCGCHVAEDSCDLLDCANGNGRFDQNTSLCWQHPRASGTFSWPLAVTYCENLVLGGHSDWVLPSRQNFMALLGNCDGDLLGGVSGYCDTCVDSTMCSDLFESDGEWHWTSSTWDIDSMWRANFITGRIGHVRDYNELDVRCVHSGP